MNRLKPLKSPQPELLDGQSCFSLVKLVFQVRQHSLIVKLMLITEPFVPSTMAWVRNCILAKCSACSTKILLDSFLENAIIEQAKAKEGSNSLAIEKTTRSDRKTLNRK